MRLYNLWLDPLERLLAKHGRLFTNNHMDVRSSCYQVLRTIVLASKKPDVGADGHPMIDDDGEFVYRPDIQTSTLCTYVSAVVNVGLLQTQDLVIGDS